MESVNRPLDGDRVLTSIQFGLLLVADGERRLAVLVHGQAEQTIRRQGRVEVMAADPDQARGFLGDLRATMRARSVYRGRVISLAAEQYGPPSVRFHALPAVAREDIVVADGVLERVERHTIGFARQRDRLLAAGRHLRRGLLLYGRPGTGKTLTAMYLAGQQPDRTVLLVTGRTLGLLRRSCELARLPAPSTVVLEDVDLIAEERTRQEPGRTTLPAAAAGAARPRPHPSRRRPRPAGRADPGVARRSSASCCARRRCWPSAPTARSWSRTTTSTRPCWSWWSRAATSPGGCSGRPDSGPGARPEAGDDPRKLTKPPGHR